MYASVARMPTTEHILLESDFRQVPDLQDARTVHARIEFPGRGNSYDVATPHQLSKKLCLPCTERQLSVQVLL